MTKRIRSGESSAAAQAPQTSDAGPPSRRARQGPTQPEGLLPQQRSRASTSNLAPRLGVLPVHSPGASSRPDEARVADPSSTSPLLQEGLSPSVSSSALRDISPAAGTGEAEAATSAAEPVISWEPSNDLHALGYTEEQLRKVKPESRSEIQKHHADLIRHGFTHADICKISSRYQSLKFVATEYQNMVAVLPELTRVEIVEIARRRSGDLALDELLKVARDRTAAPLRLNAGQLAIIAQRGERPALNALHRLGGDLTSPPLSLTPEQVVAIASNNGAKQALEAVKAQLPALRSEPYVLSTEQVVAIASNIGGKQALEAVKAQLPALRSEPYVLSTEQVVGIASNGGGKQALEAVKAHVKTLRGEPYGLSTEQVVGIASNGGGKQALEVVKLQMPVLCVEPYCLSPEQVVAIATIGGKAALEAVTANLLDLRQAPYGFSTERVVAIACIGGKPALEMVKQGLPPTRRRRTVEETPSATINIPGARELVEVLTFFRGHQRPMRAFDDALAEFQMSKPSLLKLLGRAGVTELEALGSTIPDAAKRWQRLLGALSARPTAGRAVSSPDRIEGFAESLERSLMSPSPAQERAPAWQRKRSAGASTSATSVRRRLDDATQVQAWGHTRARTPRPVHPAAGVPELNWGSHAPGSQQRPEQLPEPAQVVARHDDIDAFGLADPGTPDAGVFAFLEAEPFGPGHVGPSHPSSGLALSHSDPSSSLSPLGGVDLDWLSQLLDVPSSPADDNAGR